MAILDDTAAWTDDVPAHVNGTPGDEATLNAPLEVLAQRTSYLRERLDQVELARPAQWLQVRGGDRVTRVLVPRVTIPSGTFYGPTGWPGSADLDVGGFQVDSFLAANPLSLDGVEWTGVGAMGAEEAPVSEGGQVPARDVTLAVAKEGLALRGDSMLSLQAWAEVTLVAMALGQTARGNNQYGTDGRAAVDGLSGWEAYGMPAPDRAWSAAITRTLTGSGPQTWWAGGRPGGAADWWGNLRMMVEFPADHGYYEHVKYAELADPGGISDADVVCTVHMVERPELWAVPGVIRIGVERISYNTMTHAGAGAYTLGGLSRGINGTVASAHAEGDIVEGLRPYCIIPSGATFLVSGAGLDNTSASSTFVMDDVLSSVGGWTYPAVGDLIVMGDILGAEQMTVTAVLGSSITVNRGVNGSTKVAHADGSRGSWVRVTASIGTIVTATTLPYLSGYMSYPRGDGDLARLLLPQALSTSAPAADADWGDITQVPLGVASVVYRGASSEDYANAPRGQGMWVGSTLGHTRAGFRGMKRDGRIFRSL